MRIWLFHSLILGIVLIGFSYGMLSEAMAIHSDSDHILINNFRYTDEDGQTVTDPIATGSIARPTIDVENTSGDEVSFAFLVQTQDSNGVTVALTALEDTLQPGESKTYSMGWMPSFEDTFTTTAFFWNSIDDPTALVFPVLISITAQGPNIDPIPLEPFAPHAVPISPFEIQVSFRDNGENYRYIIERYDENNNYLFNAATIDDTFSNSETITITDNLGGQGLNPDTVYKYRVYARNSELVPGFKSFEVSARTHPYIYPLYNNEIQVTNTPKYHELSHILAEDSTGKYAAYSFRCHYSSPECNEKIFLQRLDENGNLLGEAIKIPDIYPHSSAPSAYGDFVGYLGYTGYSSDSGIIVYQISTGQSFDLTNTLQITANRVPIVYDDKLLIGQGQGLPQYLVLVDLGKIKENSQPTMTSIYAQNYVTSYDLSDRYIVYVEQDVANPIPCLWCNGGLAPSTAIVVYDMQTGQTSHTISDANSRVNHPQIFGSWIVYESYDLTANEFISTVIAKNIDTDETIALSSNFSIHPQIHGKNIVFLERISEPYYAISHYNLDSREMKLLTDKNDDYSEINAYVFDNFVLYMKAIPTIEVDYVRDLFLTKIVTEISDLSLTKSVDNQTPLVGSTVTFTVEITNDGPFPANNIVVLEKISPQLAGIQFVPSTGTVDPLTNEWLIPTLNVGQMATLAISATVQYLATITNTAEITSQDQYDPDSTPNNNDPSEDDQDTIQIQSQLLQVNADLSLTKTVDNQRPLVGDTITYTISVTNNGPEEIPNSISVSDFLPSSFTFVSDNPEGEFNTSDMFWEVFGLASGQTKTLHISGIVNSEGTITNTAEIIDTSDDVADPDSVFGNNNPNEDDQSSVAVIALLDSDSDGVSDEIELALTGDPQGLTLTQSGNVADIEASMDDLTGQISINAYGGNGELLSTITLPAGSVAPTGNVDISYEGVLFDNLGSVQLDGIVASPPGKTIQFATKQEISNFVCFNDSQNGVVSEERIIGLCVTDPANSQVRMSCPDSPQIETMSVTGFPDSPADRTYTCYKQTIDDKQYMILSGLAYSSAGEFVDEDNDSVNDLTDNCVGVANTDQVDADGDGIGDVCDADTDGDGYTTDDSELGLDCNDNDAGINPGATEIPNDGIDQDCDGVDGGSTPTLVTLEPDKDSFLRSGNHNTNEGANPNMVVRASGNNRAIISFDTSGISDTVSSATLRLFVVHNGENWGPTGRAIGSYYVTESWEEGDGANMQPGNMNKADFHSFENRGSGHGVTWRCAIDSEINNQRIDCDTRWNGGSFVPTPTDTVRIFKDFDPSNSNKTPTETTIDEWIEFDVTSDLGYCLGDDCSWIIKKVQEGQNGRVEFATKEGSSALYGVQYGESVAPQLVLTFSP